MEQQISLQMAYFINLLTKAAIVYLLHHPQSPKRLNPVQQNQSAILRQALPQMAQRIWIHRRARASTSPRTETKWQSSPSENPGGISVKDGRNRKPSSTTLPS